MKKDQQTRNSVVAQALRHVPFDGWSDATLQKAVKACKLSPATAAALFPHGAASLADAFGGWADDEMLKKLRDGKFSALRVRDKVETAVRTRLEVLDPHRDAVLKALKTPAFAPVAPRSVWRTADAIWDAAGDTATDYNRYTKRILLSGVLTATTLYWLNDDSKGHAKTWAFLSKRIGNVLKLGQAISRVKAKVRP
jgi:ubiquinone biosynthesis protein COQ9